MKDGLPYLVTFPRSGSHYFDELIYKEAGIHIEKSHTLNLLFDKNNNKQRSLITIVRDPIESITSYSAYEQSNSGPRPLFATDIRVNQLLTEYMLMHNFLYEHADYVIDFNDLISHPDAVTKKILSLLKINEEDYIFFNTGVMEYSKDYLESSKILSSYDKNLLDKFNFDSCYFYYNRILEKKIII
jgi:hypothetical protein